MILTIILGFLPAFVWLSFFIQEDIHPEPRRMIFLAFISGIISVFIGFFTVVFLRDHFFAAEIANNKTLGIYVFAGIEELIKFLAAYIVVFRSKYFDEPIDAMIYIIAAAMGFAAIENVGYLALTHFEMTEKIGIVVFRFLGATLLHALSSSFFGYYWAKGIIKKKLFLYLLIGLVAATLLHGSFNYLIEQFHGKMVYTLALLIFSAFFIFYDFEKLQKNDIINT